MNERNGKLMRALMRTLMRTMAGAVLTGALLMSAYAEESDDDSAAGPNIKIEVFGDNAVIREERIGGRLERVSIERKKGLSETYRNNRPDTLWSGPEDEVGDLPNMRKWVITTW